MLIPSCLAQPYIFASSSSGLAPFIQSYVDSDLIGRVIYLSLFALSFVSWAVLIYKWWIVSQVQKESSIFKKAFIEQKHHPLALSFQPSTQIQTPNAFYMIYTVLKTKAIELMDKNKEAELKKEFANTVYSDAYRMNLNSDDFSILESQLSSLIVALTKYLEKNLYILSTIVTLAPFLGLLGTVYGILVTFAGLSPDSSSGSTQQILGGLSLALTTTVVGLINAIPALIGYNAIKNKICDFEHEMERFATELIATFDAHYRYRKEK